MRAERLAPAKVNLFLHVGPPRADGYHPLCSLAAFADVGDAVRLEPSEAMSFAIEGRFGTELADESGNLVVRARDLALAGRTHAAPFRIVLDKRLPIAAGLGGGSSDAAATLWLVQDALGEGQDLPKLLALAGELGADGPMCVEAKPVIATGRGDVLSPPPPFPDLPAVLVNPLRPSPTGAVYRGYDATGAPGGDDAPVWPARVGSVRDMAAFLAVCRNDLEAPAIDLQPAIAEVLAALRARPETLIARMSGSGATCFALAANLADRDALAAAISAGHPDWWVAPCVLAGSA
jgi:4-diphosphocytidyl-2-C-methyl-D-erythritol kinase